MALFSTALFSTSLHPQSILRKSHSASHFPPNRLILMAMSGAKNTGLPLMNIVRTTGLPILKQLNLEEKLLRASTENWCIINDGTNEPTIVMGVSGKPAELLEVTPVLQDHVPVIRRFTGGGTVIVDHGTVFITFICNKHAISNLQPYPQPIMAWSSTVYSKVFHGIWDFRLRENDYVFANRKFGGNAQSITKDRWIHHTSFLWDFNVSNMAYLKVPVRAPKYRLARDHLEFICRMREYIPREEFIEKTIDAAREQFCLRSIEMDDIKVSADMKFTQSSKPLTREELEAAVKTSPAQILRVESL